MTDASLTLKDFLAADATKPIADGLDLGAVTAVIGAAAAALPAAAGAQIDGAFRHALDEILQVGLGDVLQASWGKAAALRDAILATRKDAGLVAIVPLLDHKVTSQHQPHIDLMYGSKSLVRIAFDISLNLMLSGVALEIRDGELAGIKAGTCTGEGILAFLGKPLLQHKSKEFALRGKLAFKKASEAVRDGVAATSQTPGVPDNALAKAPPSGA